MSVLTSSQLTDTRRLVSDEVPAVDYPKATINAALQAIEDWFEANRASGAAAINTATSPYVFSAAMKLRLFKFWLLQKYQRGG